MVENSKILNSDSFGTRPVIMTTLWFSQPLSNVPIFDIHPLFSLIVFKWRELFRMNLNVYKTRVRI